MKENQIRKRAKKAIGLVFILAYLSFMYVMTNDMSIAPYHAGHSQVLFHRFMFNAEKNVAISERGAAPFTPTRAPEKSLFLVAVSLTHGLASNLSNYTYENFKSMGQDKTFCYEQLVEVYGRPKREACHASFDATPRVFCQKSYQSVMMDFCIVEQVTFKSGGMLWLNVSEVFCPPLYGSLGDIKTKFVRTLLQRAAIHDPVSPSCKERVNIGYFYVINNEHIYFKVLGYYSIFETLLRNDHKLSDVRFYRAEELSNWPNNFADFERSLFGNVENLTDAEDVCFNQVFFVPDGYSTNPFRCKMSGEPMVFNCSKCHGSAMPYHAVHLFKQYVMAKCGLSRNRVRSSDILNITMILRKPYRRFGHDNAEHFNRVLLNSDQVIGWLKNISSVRVQAVYMETLDFCEQVRLAWYSDLLIGVHGSGLVHLWWIGENAEVMEIEPQDQRTNPTFRTLSRLTHTRYSRYTIEEYMGTHVVLGGDFLEFVRKRIDILKSNWFEETSTKGEQMIYEGTAPDEDQVILDTLT